MGSGLLACLIVNPPSTQNKVSKESIQSHTELLASALLGDREQHNIHIFFRAVSVFMGYFLEYVFSFSMGVLFGQQYSQFLNTYSLYSELPFYGILFTHKILSEIS